MKTAASIADIGSAIFMAFLLGCLMRGLYLGTVDPDGAALGLAVFGWATASLALRGFRGLKNSLVEFVNS